MTDRPALTNLPDLAHLPAPTVRLLHLASLHPGPSLHVDALTALTGEDEHGTDRMRDQLSLLVDRGLLCRSGDHYTFPACGLDRLLVRDDAEAHLPAHTVQAALQRLFDYYLHTTAAASAEDLPWAWRLSPVHTYVVQTDRSVFTTAAAARAWLGAELPSAAALTHLAYATHRHGLVWQFAELLSPALARCRDTAVWADLAVLGLTAAQALNHTAAVARMHLVVGELLLAHSQAYTARRHYAHALRLSRDIRHLPGEAAAHGALAEANTVLGEHGQALYHLTAALAQHSRLGHDWAAATARGRLADIHRTIGQADDALPLYEEAVTALGRLRDDTGLARVLTGHARTLLALGDADQAAVSALRARDAAARTGDRPAQTQAHLVLAAIARACGDRAAEQAHLDAADHLKATTRVHP